MTSTVLELPTDGPLVLLPVRIETAFRSNPRVLNVRIYPDEIHIDTHVPDLLQDEIDWGNKYLKLTVETDKKTYWHQLAARYGPQRAAWIIRSLEAKPQQTSKRTDSWTRAPYAYALPNRWIVIGYVKDATTGAYKEAFSAQGNKIADPLPTGPQPRQPNSNALPSDDPMTLPDDDPMNLLGDDPMNWMIDFNKAVAVGMALSIPISDSVLKNGLDRLIVLGVKTELSMGESSLKAGSSTRLRSTLEAQHYTRGISFVPQGTPTNNTSEAPSGYASTDPNFEISYRIECGAKRCKSGDGANGSVLAKALGLNTTLFEHVRFAGEVDPRNSQFSDDVPDAGREQIDARHINTALWSATWGYYLSQLLAGAFQTADDTISRVRRHFIDYVRGRGPVPALRIGRQPYSFLPVTSLNYWKIPSNEAQASSGLSAQELDVMAALLLDLRNLWSASVPAVPRVGAQDTPNPQERLLEALSLEATSKSYAVRNALGSQFVTYYWNFLKRYCGPQWWEQQEQMARGVFASLKSFQQARSTYAQPPLAQLYPRLINFVAVGGAFDLDAPLADIVPASANAQLSRNYIEWLRVAGSQEIRKRNSFFKQGSIPLLYLLLRYATLREYAAAAFRLSPPTAESERYEPELININPEASQRTLTVWDQLEKIIEEAMAPPTPIRAHLDKLLSAASDIVDADLPEFTEFRESLRWLKDRPASVLEPLVSETIDLCSHRLDAWITSLATRRLDKVAREGGGLYLGGYGWVEDLRPAASSSVKSDAGFIHAPSMTHAAAAAMLYSAHLSHGAIEGNSAFAVNLPSQRVKQALWLLEGIRQGQTLGALLGYRFERGLHDSKQDKYIAVYRKLAPLSTDTTASNSGTAESVAANNVADGLTLISLWQKGQIPSSEAEAKDVNDIKTQLTALDALVDALGDLLVAESAYQTARGNTSRAGAVLDALGRGDTPPPEIEVTRTPRTGTGLTHRVLIPFSCKLADPPGWPALDPNNDIHVRALAERNLNAWVGSMLDDPSRFVCRYEYVDPQSGARLAEPGIARLSVLYLSPLDLLYMIQGSDEALQSELERRLTYWLMLPEQRDGISADARVLLTFSRGSWVTDSGWATFSELLEAVAAIRRVLVSARALEPRDLTWPANASLDGLDVTELKKRVAQAMEKLESAVERLKAKLAALNDALAGSPAPETVDARYPDDLRSALFYLSFFGVQGAAPAPPSSDVARDCKLLQAQAGTVLALAQRRADDAAAILNENDPQSQATYIKALQAVFGPDFMVLTRFKVSDAASLQAFNNSLALQGGDSFASLALFQRIAHVREASARLDTALIYANALKLHPTLGFVVGQLPSGATSERWVGLANDSSTAQPIPGGRLSLLALTDDALAKQPQAINLTDLSGLLIDEWVEVVPNASETTGIAFQYNEPGARPPQAILLAVAPAGQTKWNLELLSATLMETLDLAKVRMVDPDIVPDVGQFLPALFFAVNQAGEAVSVDFRRVAKKRTRRKG